MLYSSRTSAQKSLDQPGDAPEEHYSWQGLGLMGNWGLETMTSVDAYQNFSRIIKTEETDLGIGGRIILKLILYTKSLWTCGLDSMNITALPSPPSSFSIFTFMCVIQQPKARFFNESDFKIYCQLARPVMLHHSPISYFFSWLSSDLLRYLVGASD
jgi:hypothetical protein